MTRLLLATVLFAGCATRFEPEAPDPAEIKPLIVPLPGEEDQGRHLLGKLADPLVANGEFISVTAPPGMTLQVSGSEIQLTTSAGTSVPPLHLQFPATGGRVLRIDAIDPDAGYLIRYHDHGSSTWQDYCDATESAYAIAMPGYWSGDRMHEAREGTATFACQIQGKAAKCMSWGYRPETDLGAGPGDINWDLNQACIQMAMALYCGPGDTPHTREKTPILIRDFIEGAEPNETDDPLPLTPSTYPPTPPPPDNYYLEAAWQPRVAVKCLSHIRWADEKLGGPCPTVLHDPRVVRSAKYCEDGVDTDTRTLLNASKTMDIGLHRWSNSAGDTLTTVHGYVESDLRPSMTSVPPVGYNGPALSDEGYLIRNLTDGLVEGVDARRVYRLHHVNGDTVVGFDGMMDPYVSGYDRDTSTADADFEGFVLVSNLAGTTALYLWHLGNDYVTTTQKTKPKGYTKVGLAPIGYVISDPL